MKTFLIILLIVVVAGAATLRVRYGGGEPYPDLTASPRLGEDALEVVLAYPEPIGNVAVSPEGRVFFTIHPESRPRGNKLLEWVADAAEPYPRGVLQAQLFDTILGIVVDRQNRLWTIDNGNHGFRTPRLIAFDLDTGAVVHDHEFDAAIAPAGSFLQDLQVSADGGTVVIADASIWRRRPALIVYDVATEEARRVLEGHRSVMPDNYVIRATGRTMSFLGGLVSLKAGVDGIAFDANNEWFYYAAMNRSGLYRVPVPELLNPELSPRQLAASVERHSDKPLSDGLSTDTDGNVYVTDVEHGAVFVADPAGNLATLVASPRVRWADALSFGPDGWLYLADSAIQEQVLKPAEHIRRQGPYYVFRFRPGHTGIPGQ